MGAGTTRNGHLAPSGHLIVDDLDTSEPKLSHVTLSVQPGMLVGVIGPSGSGKSSFLAAVAAGNPRGVSYYDREELTGDGAQDRKLGHTTQKRNPVLESDTVRECLRSYGRLQGIPARDVEARVERLLAELDLTEVANNRIKTLSGGQAKRLGLAHELLGEPEVLLADEPTSELDPAQAKNVTRIVSDYVRAVPRRIALVVIHDKDTQAWDAYDRLVFIAREGRVAFEGTPVQASAHFAGMTATEIMTLLAAREVPLFAQPAWPDRAPDPVRATRVDRGRSPALAALAGVIAAIVLAWAVGVATTPYVAAVSAPQANSYLVAFGDGRIEVRDRASNNPTTTLSQAGVAPVPALWEVAVDSSLRSAASTTATGGVVIWDLRARRPAAMLTGLSSPSSDQPVYALRYMSGDERLIVAASGGRVAVVDVADPAHPRTEALNALPGNPTILSLAGDSAHDRVAIGTLDGRVFLWQLDTGETNLLGTAIDPTTHLPGGALYSLAFSPDGSMVAGAGQAGFVYCWHVPDGRLLASMDDAAVVYAVAFAPNGSLYGTGDDGVIRGWDPVSGKTIYRYQLDSPVRTIAFAPGGSLVAGEVSGSVAWFR